MMLMWITLLVLVCIGHSDPICKVTCDSKGWNYQIIGDENPPCPAYQWNNETNFVLANDKQKSRNGNVVQGWNDTHIKLSICVNISRNRNCPKEDREHVVQCKVDCTVTSGAPQSNGIILGFSIAVPLVVVLVVLVLAGWFYTHSRDAKKENKKEKPLMSDNGEGPNLLMKNSEKQETKST